MNRNTIDGNLLFAGNLQNNVTNPAIAASLVVFGYDSTRIEAGNTLLTNAQTLVLDQAREYGEQFAATDAMYTAQKIANGTYIKHLKIARIALRDDRGAEQSMMLGGDRSQTFSGWLKQSKAFYTNGLASQPVKDAMAGFGMTEAKLQEGMALVIEAEQKLNEQLKEKGEAQQATLDRDDALEALYTYVGDLVKICRIALEGQPQYLEMLGITVSNE